MVVQRSIGTHSGAFHADEVTACALLILFKLADRDKIRRTRDAKVLQQCEFVCDVGGLYDPARKKFDHHQADYEGDFSSAGMILLFLKNSGIINDAAYKYLNNALIKGIDDHDNGRVHPVRGSCSFSHVIANFVPVEHDVDQLEENRSFFEALDFALAHLQRLWKRYQYNLHCREIVKECMEKSEECLIFDQSIPWLESFFDLDGEHHPAQFVIMPAKEHWKLRGVPPNYENRMQVRIPMPQEWAGLLADELKRISGIPGAIFCHKGRFISVWQTKEDALKALDKTLRLHKAMEVKS